MAVSKRLRYEILRRDNHTCRYCGAAAPDVKLTVDHVVPVALGGTDVAENLVAACGPCNAGKSSSSPDAPIVTDVQQDALRWQRAMAMAADIQQRDARIAASMADCVKVDWRYIYVGTVHVSEGATWFYTKDPDRKYFAVVRENDDYSEKSLTLCDTQEEAEAWLAEYLRRRVPPMPDGWRQTVLNWFSQGVGYEDIYRAIEISKAKDYVALEHRWRYFCGVVWGMLKDRQNMAQDILARAEADGEWPT